MGETETWNMANATLKRLSWLMDQCCIAAQTGKLVAWYNALRDMRRNIIPFLEDSDFKESESKWEELPQGWRNPAGGVMPNHYAKVHRTLDEIYILYVTGMKRKGLLMPKTKDDSKAILNM